MVSIPDFNAYLDKQQLTLNVMNMLPACAPPPLPPADPRIHTLPHLLRTDFLTFVPALAPLLQRLLIPLTAGGLVIGRKGANITALLEASGAKVTLGQKSEIKANERLVTVQGTLTEATTVRLITATRYGTVVTPV